jgi:hypothetical protein
MFKTQEKVEAFLAQITSEYDEQVLNKLVTHAGDVTVMRPDGQLYRLL